MNRCLLVSVMIVCTLAPVRAQIGDSQRFFPRAVGNVWKWYDHYSDSTHVDEITRDSTDAGGQDYLFFNNDTLPRYKLDTLHQVYFLSKRYDSQGHFIGLNTILWFKLDAQPGDSFLTTNNSGKVVVSLWPTTIFGQESALKLFSRYSGADRVPFAWYYLARDFGLVRATVDQSDASGDQEVLGCIINGMRYGVLAGTMEPQTVSKVFRLFQNYPNPFNPMTTIRFEIPSRGHVSVTVSDLLGRKIATLLSKELSPGSHEVLFDGQFLASGVYFYTVRIGALRETRPMYLSK